jgi:hypothetical protein
MKREEIYQKLKENPKNVRFEELCRAAELFGFAFRGWHRQPQDICQGGYKRDVKLSRVKGKAKPSQVRHFITIIEYYNLAEE